MGVAFEEVCSQYVRHIKTALQIAGVPSKESSLIVKGDKDIDGMQIDLLIDRADDVVNVCEMKYNKGGLTINKAYTRKLDQRLAALEQMAPNKTFHLTLISASPVEHSEYADVFTSAITADDLFS